MFVAKANCYNQDFEVAKYIEESVDYYAVFSLEEGIKLREYNIKKPILILKSDITEVEDYIKYDFDINLCKLEDICYVNSICKIYNKKIKIHIPINTGMNRFGIKDINYFRAILVQLHSLEYIEFYALYTHLTMPTNNQISNQINLFNNFYKLSNLFGYKPVLHYKSTNYINNELIVDSKDNFVRIGIGNYLKSIKSTKDCVELYSKIIEIKEIGSGETVGYVCDYISTCKTKIAVVLGGYADGINKNFIGYKVKIRQYYCKIIAICMDVFFVELENNNIKNGDNVCILNINDDKINLDSLSYYTKQTKYELLVGLRLRIKTIYKNK